jgi:mRNA capping enzyme, beta chain
VKLTAVSNPTCLMSVYCSLLTSTPTQVFLPKVQHKHFNTLLNNLLTAPISSSSPLTYSHKYLIDSFYASDTNDRDKIRVTRDEKTNAVIECMRKVRLGNLDVYSPRQAADWRISVNLEVPGSSIAISSTMPKPLKSSVQCRIPSEPRHTSGKRIE